MIKVGIILWLYAFILVSLSLPSIGETNAGTKIVWDQVDHYIHSGKDYSKIYGDLVNRFNDALHTASTSNEKSQLLEQIGKQLHNVLSWSNIVTGTNKDDFTRSMKSATQGSMDRIGDAISRLMNLVPKSIKDQLNAVELRIKCDVVFSFAETGFMINSLFKTWDEVKKSEQFRTSPELQQKTTKIKKLLDEAEKLYRKADAQIDQIYTISDIDKKQIALRIITLDLERANLKCEHALQVFENILNDIHQKVEKLSSAKADHRTGITTSLLRLINTVIEYMLKPASGLTQLFKFLFATTATMHTTNSIGHIAGVYWTRSEIQELQKHQVILTESETKIKQLIDDINYGLKTLEKLNQYM